MTAEDYINLLAWAAYFTGYPEPPVVPMVVFSPASYFEKGVAARFVDGVVHVKAEAPWLESYIVHEDCHALQELYRPDMPLCERERECYVAQNKYLERNGEPAIFKVPACPAKESE